MKPTPAKILIAFALVLSGVLGLTITTHAWETGYVDGECYEWTDTTLSPLGYVSFVPVWRGFFFTDETESWDWAEEGDSCEDSELNDWTAFNTGAGLEEITSAKNVDGLYSLKLFRSGTDYSHVCCSRENAVESIEVVQFWWWKSDTTILRYFQGSDGECISWYHETDGRIRIYDGVSSDYYAFGCEEQWNHCYLKIYWAYDDYMLILNGELIEANAPMRYLVSQDDQVRFDAGTTGFVYIDDINFCDYVVETGAFDIGYFSMLLDGLDEDTVYKIRAYATQDNVSFGMSDWFTCKTGGYQEFPIWLVILLFAVVLLGIYTKSLVLSIAGIILCVVSYSWLLQSSADDVGVWGGAAFFLILIAWIILNLVYRARNG